MASEGIWKALAVLSQVYGRQLSEEAARIYALDLADYPEPLVMSALSRCRRECRTFPTIADIISRIDDGRPGAEEAWAMIPHDEYQSVVWTEEMRDAFGIARPILESDPIAARMAFREAYLKLLSDARAAKKPAKWEPSLGLDPTGREQVLREAARRGRISHEQASGLLPAPIKARTVHQLQGTSDLKPVDPKVFLAEIRRRIGGGS